MPYTDTQIEALRSATPEVQQQVVQQLSDAERIDLAQSLTRYNTKHAQPSNDVSAARLVAPAKPQNSTQANLTQNSQPSLMSKAGNALTSFALGAGAPLYSLTGQLASGFGTFPNRFAQGQTDIANQANQYRQELGNQGGVSGFANNLAGQVGQMSTFMPLAYATGVPALEAGAASYLGSLGTSALIRGGIGGLMATPLMTAMNPTDPNKSFGQSVAEAAPSNMALGALISGGSEAISRLPGAAKSAVQYGKTLYKGAPAAPVAPEVLNQVPFVDEILHSASQDPALVSAPRKYPNQPITVADLREISSGNDEAAAAAKAKLAQVNIATSIEHSPVQANGNVVPINLSRADVVNDPIGHNDEASLQGRSGSVGNHVRIEQGQQIGGAVQSLRGRLQGELEQQLGPSADPSLSTSDRANQAIQKSLSDRLQTNKANNKALYDGMYADIAAKQTPQNPDLVDTEPAWNRVNQIINENQSQIAKDPELAAVLKQYAETLDPKSVADKSIRGVRNAVTAMEDQQEAWKNPLMRPNRNASRLLGKVSTMLDAAADQRATAILGDPARVKAASADYKANVVPLQDHDTGIPQIIAGTYPDRATKNFISTANPDLFKAATSWMDQTGQTALKLKLMEEAQEHATGNGSKSFDPQDWSKRINSRSDELRSLYGTAINPSQVNLSDVESLANLVDSAPHAGMAKGEGSMLGRTGRMSMGAGLGAVAGGGLPGAAVGIGAEMAGEAGWNGVVSRRAFRPNFEDLVRQYFPQGREGFAIPEVPGVSLPPVPKGR